MVWMLCFLLSDINHEDERIIKKEWKSISSSKRKLLRCIHSVGKAGWESVSTFFSHPCEAVVWFRAFRLQLQVHCCSNLILHSSPMLLLMKITNLLSIPSARLARGGFSLHAVMNGVEMVIDFFSSYERTFRLNWKTHQMSLKWSLLITSIRTTIGGQIDTGLLNPRLNFVSFIPQKIHPSICWGKQSSTFTAFD